MRVVGTSAECPGQAMQSRHHVVSWERSQAVTHCTILAGASRCAVPMFSRIIIESSNCCTDDAMTRTLHLAISRTHLLRRDVAVLRVPP